MYATALRLPSVAIEGASKADGAVVREESTCLLKVSGLMICLCASRNRRQYTFRGQSGFAIFPVTGADRPCSHLAKRDDDFPDVTWSHGPRQTRMAFPGRTRSLPALKRSRRGRAR